MELPPTLPTLAGPTPTPAALNLVVPPRSHFAGNWFWPKPSSPNRTGALYPPEFIETAIVEQNGSLHGKYRARYRVTDRAISPNVNFEFDGKASGAAAQLSFFGEGGAHGEVKIKLISDTSMELKWQVTVLGKSFGLSSGTAVLVRKAD